MKTGRRRALKKPKGKEGFCWAWKNGHKKRGVAAQKQKDWAAAETHRCHRPGGGESGRCRSHGGTTKRGKEHHSYKHGFYSSRYHGMLARAGAAQEAVEVAASSLEELAVHKVIIDHKLGEINASGPSDEAWRLRYDTAKRSEAFAEAFRQIPTDTLDGDPPEETGSRDTG